MSGEHKLERSVLEGKERDELHAIADALGVKPGSRTKKADLVDKILQATGVTPNGSATTATDQATARRRRKSRSAPAQRRRPPTQRKTPSDTPAENEATSEAVHVTTCVRRPRRGARGRDGHRPGGPGDCHRHPDARRPRAARRTARHRLRRQAAREHVAATKAAVATRTATGSTASAIKVAAAIKASAIKAAATRTVAAIRTAAAAATTKIATTRPTTATSAATVVVADVTVSTAWVAAAARSATCRATHEQQVFTGEPEPVAGLLDLADAGFGLIRVKGYLPSAEDCYVPVGIVKRLGLRKGDRIVGTMRPAGPQEKYGALLDVDTVSEQSVDEAKARPKFDDLTPLFPDEQLKLEMPGESEQHGRPHRRLDVADRQGPARPDRVAAQGRQDHRAQADRDVDRGEQPRRAPHRPAGRRAPRGSHRHASLGQGRSRVVDLRPPVRRAHAGRRAHDRARQAHGRRPARTS